MVLSQNKNELLEETGRNVPIAAGSILLQLT
jgi:hypothetical protein